MATEAVLRIVPLKPRRAWGLIWPVSAGEGDRPELLGSVFLVAYSAAPPIASRTSPISRNVFRMAGSTILPAKSRSSAAARV